MMKQQMDRHALTSLLQAKKIESLSIAELTSLFREELGDFLPDGVYGIDPRNGERIIYTSARARRPHDNRPPADEVPDPEAGCIICQGRTTGIVDVAELSEGFTFINKNLFPVLYPFDRDGPEQLGKGSGQAAYGLHFLQWTSSLHNIDWPNISRADGIVVLGRLAALEKKLLTGAVNSEPASETLAEQPYPRGFVLITKNYGRLVGGSLSHGHQQIAFSNVMPRRFHDNQRFEKERGELFSAYLLRENPSQLTIRDYGPVRLVTPHFMRRPYDMMLILKDTTRQYLHQLNEGEMMAVAEAWHDAMRAIHIIMPAIGREIAYNVVTHNGPGAGLYFEFLPYTQENGGFEHLGLTVCQADPGQAAAQLREILANDVDRG